MLGRGKATAGLAEPGACGIFRPGQDTLGVWHSHFLVTSGCCFWRFQCA